MGRDPPGQFQEGLKPFQLALAKKFRMDPGIGAADGGADGDGDNIHQLVASGAFHPWVVQVGEMIENSCFRSSCHGPSPPCDSPDHGKLAYL